LRWVAPPAASPGGHNPTIRSPKLTDLATVVLVAVVVAGIVMLIVVPAESKTAIALAVIACALAAANYAMTPDVDEIAKDVRRLREAAEQPRPPSEGQAGDSQRAFRFMCLTFLGVIVAILSLGRRRSK
jgi:hypothetical protein